MSVLVRNAKALSKAAGLQQEGEQECGKVTHGGCDAGTILPIWPSYHLSPSLRHEEKLKSNAIPKDNPNPSY